MFRLFFFIALFFTFSNGTIIYFEEEKYIEVMDNSIRKKGTLEFKDNKIILQYDNSKRILIYEDDSLSIQIDDEIQEINLESQIALKMVFLLIESIQKNDFLILQEYFTINKKNKATLLFPNKSLENYIESVEFRKTEILEYLTIIMTNGNKTTIREIND